MVVGQFSYKFEDLAVLVLKGGGESAYFSGEALIQFDWDAREWKITGIWIQNELSRSGEELVELEKDHIGPGVGSWALVHKVIMDDRAENISAEVDRIIDTDNREGKAR